VGVRPWAFFIFQEAKMTNWRERLIGSPRRIVGLVVVLALVLFFCCCCPLLYNALRPGNTAPTKSIAQTTGTVSPTKEVASPTNTSPPTKAKTPTITLTPSITPTPTITLTPSKTPKPSKTPTQTVTPNATKTARAATATYLAGFSDINYRELRDYADAHKGEQVCVRGRVFNIVGDDTLQMYFAGTYDALYVKFAAPFSKVYENSSIRVCGTVYGTVSFQNSFGGTVTQPALSEAFIP
jgi:hypothetical protein